MAVVIPAANRSRDEWDEIPDEELEETLIERLEGLTEVRYRESIDRNLETSIMHVSKVYSTWSSCLPYEPEKDGNAMIFWEVVNASFEVVKRSRTRVIRVSEKNAVRYDNGTFLTLTLSGGQRFDQRNSCFMLIFRRFPSRCAVRCARRPRGARAPSSER